MTLCAMMVVPGEGKEAVGVKSSGQADVIEHSSLWNRSVLLLIASPWLHPDLPSCRHRHRHLIIPTIPTAYTFSSLHLPAHPLPPAPLPAPNAMSALLPVNRLPQSPVVLRPSCAERPLPTGLRWLQMPVRLAPVQLAQVAAAALC